MTTRRYLNIINNLDPKFILAASIVLSVQSILVHYLPLTISLLPALSLLSLYSWKEVRCPKSTVTGDDHVIRGRYTAKLPSISDGQSQSNDVEMAIFVVGAYSGK